MTDFGTVRYPLLFTYHDKVVGKGYLAGVRVAGRALLVREDDDAWWVYGVNPGGIAEGAEGPGRAHSLFRRTFTTVLFDLAEEARDFDSFKSAVSAFFYETNEPTEAAWLEAVTAQRNDPSREPADAFAAALERKPAETERGVWVENLNCAHLNPSINAVEPEPAVAA